MPMPAPPPELAAAFAALGDPVRLGLVARLAAEGPTPLAALAAGTGISRQAVSRHLRVMEAAGLVLSLRQGRAAIWRLRPAALGDLGDFLGRLVREAGAR